MEGLGELHHRVRNRLTAEVRRGLEQAARGYESVLRLAAPDGAPEDPLRLRRIVPRSMADVSLLQQVADTDHTSKDVRDDRQGVVRHMPCDGELIAHIHHHLPI